MRSIPLLAVMAALLVSASTRAENPAFPSEGRRLIDGMAGAWKSKDLVGTWKPDDPGTKAEELHGVLESKCIKIDGGTSLVCSGWYQYKGPGRKRHEFGFVVGWDPATGTGHMLSADEGGITDAVGKWKDEKTITFDSHSKTGDGKDVEEHLTFTFDSPTKQSFRSEGRMGATRVTYGGTSTRASAQVANK